MSPSGTSSPASATILLRNWALQTPSQEVFPKPASTPDAQETVTLRIDQDGSRSSNRTVRNSNSASMQSYKGQRAGRTGLINPGDLAEHFPSRLVPGSATSTNSDRSGRIPLWAVPEHLYTGQVPLWAQDAQAATLWIVARPEQASSRCSHCRTVPFQLLGQNSTRH